MGEGRVQVADLDSSAAALIDSLTVGARDRDKHGRL